MQILVLPLDDLLHALHLIDEMIHFIILQALQHHHEANAHNIAVEPTKGALSIGAHSRGTLAANPTLFLFSDLFMFKVVLKLKYIFRTQSYNSMCE